MALPSIAFAALVWSGAIAPDQVTRFGVWSSQVHPGAHAVLQQSKPENKLAIWSQPHVDPTTRVTVASPTGALATVCSNRVVLQRWRQEPAKESAGLVARQAPCSGQASPCVAWANTQSGGNKRVRAVWLDEARFARVVAWTLSPPPRHGGR